MTDRHIDAEETQVYGPYSVARLRSTVKGRIKELDDAVEHVAVQLEEATHEVRAALDAARATDADGRSARSDAAPILAQAKEFLSRFSAHLDAHPEVDRRLFFVKDGTVRGVGASAPKILLGVQRIEDRLGEPPSVPDGKAWRDQAADISGRLAPALAVAGTARMTRREQTPALARTRAAWLATYQAAKSLAECVLRLSGHLELLSSVFYDLTLSPGANAVDTPPPTNGKTADSGGHATR